MPHLFLNPFSACITGKKRAISKKNDQGGKKQEKHDKENICKVYLPEELMIESILTRLPARTLAVCSCVSKSWYNSILNDSRFSVVHHTQNKNKVSLVFNLLNVSRDGKGMAYFFSLLGREKAMDIRCFSAPSMQGGIIELVGFCNGLACMKIVGTPTTYGTISIFNPNRGESLVLSYLPPTGGYRFLCHGFGFDSSSQVYKAVMVFTSEANNEFLCMVITLGTMSWRKIVTSTFDISRPPGSSPFPSRMVTRTSRTLCRQATFCGGDLFWKTKCKVGDQIVEMLLSFDLHNEKIRFIGLPTECTPTRATYERQYSVVDHLLEFKGYPCIARSERVPSTRSNNDHCGHRCNYQTGVCCCCYNVRMYILKDKDKQVWTREETFDVQIMDQEGSLPTPLCCHFDTSAALPPTRMLTFSDQTLLYWFSGERLIFYSLKEKSLKVVECSHFYPRIFQTRMNEDLKRCIGDDDNIYCPSMDYQLHAQVENMVSLKTFIPKEATTSQSGCPDDLMHLNNLAAGWLTTGRKEHTFYAYY